ncbi:MAG: beta-ketoacyl-[acyl-carrier-protein] synthase family protein [Desulfuromonadaceae bacterium]|nr:beta-ketoacyl-[acyl-carrier-protein] synthase family protein [Desulfuromonadaceae bacterium]
MAELVCITGIGCLCAAGNGLDEVVNTIFAGQRRAASPRAFTTSHPQPYPVFAVEEGWDVEPEDADLLKTSRLGLAAMRQALDQAGWSVSDLRGLRVGVCMGTTVGCAMNNEAFYAGYRSGATPDMQPIRRFLASNPAEVIHRRLGVSGPCQTIVNACSSGTDAIGLGSQWLQAGLCDVVLAGGADELCRTTYNGFASLQISASELCRPFSVDRCGLNLGEGAAVLVLEKRSLRSDKSVQGLVRGYGSGTDGWHLTAPHPEGRGLRQALTEAFRTSGIQPSQLSFINAHGTGTRENDRAESLVLRECLPNIPFHTTKGYTGHTLGAAGAIEAALTLAFLLRQQMPASAGFGTPDPELAMTPTRVVTPFEGNLALSQSLAFGGNNAALILQRGERCL